MLSQRAPQRSAFWRVRVLGKESSPVLNIRRDLRDPALEVGVPQPVGDAVTRLQDIPGGAQGAIRALVAVLLEERVGIGNRAIEARRRRLVRLLLELAGSVQALKLGARLLPHLGIVE